MRSSLGASSCLNRTPVIFAAGTECSDTAGTFSSSISSRRNVIGYRASGHAGASFDLFYALASIGGFLSYDNKAPVFEAQRGVSSNGALQTGTPAGIQFRGALSYGGYASIRVPFGL